jgi:PPOX class probable F420-dependent enzyme
MQLTDAQREAVKGFLGETTRGVFMTRRRDGGIQSTPMSLVADDEGNVLTATRGTNAKVKNLQRDPYAAVCIITTRFLGPWLHVEGQAEIEYLPDAMRALAEYYRRRGIAEDTESDAFKNRMREEVRCLIRVPVKRVVQPPDRPAARAARA